MSDPVTAGTHPVEAVCHADESTSAPATMMLSTPASTTGKWVTGYWADWTVGNMIRYPYTNIDWSALTHLTVALAYPTAEANIAYRGGNLNSSLAQQVTVAAHAHGRKALLMVGGAGSASDFVTALNYGDNAPETFVTNLVDRAKADGFDGMDIDWEGLYPPDYDLFKKLALALRAKWPEMILTCAIGWDQTENSFFGTLKDPSGNWLFDQMNVMTYDAANNWGGWISWFHNALADEGPDHPSSVVADVGRLNAIGGVQKSRIGMGIPFYGSAWTGGDPPVTGPRQAIPQGSGGAVASQGMDSIWTYKFIMDNYYQPYDDETKIGYVYDAAAGAAYITGGPTGYSRNNKDKVTFISYDDPTSIAAKGAWIKSNGYGGTIIWLINEGAIDESGTNPLLDAVRSAFLE